ncbi:hypothetical protein ACIRJO_20400 [Streptomyces sp. NPDC102394]|uniref:hypothetical protein n=1 Tax=Streptomyces sp. NPDC102394 TaxID=3366167 RepID=UPI0037F21676
MDRSLRSAAADGQAADHRGELTPSREIAEKAWFAYADRGRVSAVDRMVFDALHEAGRLL